jgi:hypothetical protein
MFFILILGHNLNISQFLILSRILSTNTSIKILKLKEVVLDKEKLIYLKEGLILNKNILKLNISNSQHNFNDEELDLLSEIILYNKSMKVFKLSKYYLKL